MRTLFVMNSFGINGDVLQQCVALGRPITFPGEMWLRGCAGAAVPPWSWTRHQVLLGSKAVPNSPPGVFVLIAVVLEGPESSDCPSCSCPQIVSGPGLARAPLQRQPGVGWDGAAPMGALPAWYHSRRIPQQGRRQERILLQRRDGWLPAWSLSPAIPYLDRGTE